jgi:ATP-binding cassette subfamily B protein
LTDSGRQHTLGSSLRFLWRSMTLRRRRHFYVASGVMLLGTLAELMTIGAVLPFLAIVSNPGRTDRIPGFGRLAEAVGATGPFAMIVLAAILLIAAAVFAALIRLLLTWVSLNFVMVLSHEIGSQVFARMLRQPYGYYVTRNTAQLIAGVEKIQTVVWGVLMPGMQGATAAVMSLGIVLLLFAIDPFTASVSAAVMTLSYLGVSLSVRRRLRRNSERMAYAAVQRVQTIQEGLGGIRDVLLEQSQEVFESKYRRVDYDYRHAQAVNNFINVGPRYIVEGTGIVLIALLALYLSSHPGGVIAAIPILGALALGAQRLLPLLQQAYTGWSSLAGNRQMLFDVVDLMQAPVVTSEARDGSKRPEPFRRDLNLEGVGFRYQGRDYALRGIDLRIPKGARVGFIGETGSGKSTLLDLIMGLLEPTEGRISVDGEPLTDRNRAMWQGQIAHVPQAIYLTDATIASNIAFGEPDDAIDMARVEEAARLAHIDGFVRGLPDGYSTPAGERGVRLSGGQRQRIGIARALYKRAPLLIFDEATSALDDATEKAIMRSIDEIGDDVTLLMIAHRTSTLVGCDLVVRMAAGQIAQTGSYEEVVGGALNAPEA